MIYRDNNNFFRENVHLKLALKVLYVLLCAGDTEVDTIEEIMIANTTVRHHPVHIRSDKNIKVRGTIT
jgi:hypothetical protein